MGGVEHIWIEYVAVFLLLLLSIAAADDVDAADDLRMG